MKLTVNGGTSLLGEVKTQGAKNAVLPILSACVVCRGDVVLHNCPDLSDVRSAIKILEHLGLIVTREKDTLIIKCGQIKNCSVPENLMREMRSSVVFLGAILASCGCADISMPGGCELGPRPIDMHLSSLKKLGAEIKDEHGRLKCRVKDKLCGCNIDLWFASVGATENIILASALAKGKTVITNAAREPEIVDLANFLNACGAKIYGAGESTVVIEGVDKLHGCEYSVMPDRIAAVTYLASAAVTGGDVNVLNVKREHIVSVTSLFEKAGGDISFGKDSVRLKQKERPKPLYIVKTMPYPGFPTDAQAIIMTMCALSSGTTMFVETIFENRFRHVDELVRMGANIKTEGKVSVVNGVEKLHSANVNCTDLRGGAALVLAALSAEGETKIDSIYHIDRGYEKIENNFKALGADIKRISP